MMYQLKYIAKGDLQTSDFKKEPEKVAINLQHVVKITPPRMAYTALGNRAVGYYATVTMAKGPKLHILTAAYNDLKQRFCNNCGALTKPAKDGAELTWWCNVCHNETNRTQ